MALDIRQFQFAGGAPLDRLNYGGNSRSQITGNPFKENSQEFQEYEQRYAATPQSQGGGLPDYTYLARQQLQLQQEANQPAVTSLQAQIPEVSQRFAGERQRLEAERQPLQQRYQNILDEIGRRERRETERVERTASQEYSRRGIPLSSTAFQEALNQARQPVSEFYTGQYRTTAQEGEAAQRELVNLIANLANQETEQQRAIRNTIAQLQAGGSREALSNALTQLQQQQQAQQFSQELGFRERQSAADLALRQAAENRAAALQEYNLGVARQTDPLELALRQLQLQTAQQTAPVELASLQSQLGYENLARPLQLQEAALRLSQSQQAFPFELQKLQADIARTRQLASGGGGGLSFTPTIPIAPKPTSPPPSRPNWRRHF